jgi:ATP-dependent RNA helicase DDX31/DBP7
MHRDHGTVALILSPTRELCLQILETSKKLCQVFHWIVPGILIGGEKKKSEKARLRKGVNLLICTPGRLLDHLRTTQSFQLHNLRWLVFDEADRLLDMGFERDVTAIIDLLTHKLNPDASATDAEPPKIHPQTVLCSATLDVECPHFSNLIRKE